MSLKGRVMEFLVVHDLVPLRLRWKRSASAVGRMFNDVFHLLEKNERAKLARMMYSWGLEDADEVVKTLGVKRDLHGCAIALMGVHRIFGIKSRIAKEGNGELVIQATECLWKDKKGWSAEVCAAIDAYEKGLIKGINRSISSRCTKRRSRGDEVCELVLSF
jgi:hypothetical protein